MNPKIGTSYATACDVNLGDYFSRCFDLSDILFLFKTRLCDPCFVDQVANLVRYIYRPMLREFARGLRWCCLKIHLMP